MMTVAVLTGVLSGCGSKYQPVSIQEDVDKCGNCNMQVADNAFSTEIILKDGKTLKFDDLGCLNKWEKTNGVEQVGAEFVRDYSSKAWVPLKDATYVYDKSFKTPMGFGVESFKDKQAAEKYLSEQGKGKLMSAKDLGTHTWEKNKEQGDMKMKMDQGGSGEMKMDQGSTGGMKMDQGSTDGKKMDMKGSGQ